MTSGPAEPAGPLTALIDDLRRAGVGVSVGEHLDAARALAAMPLADPGAVRSALQSALVKRAEHLDAFATLFELHFLGTSSEPGRPLEQLSAAQLQAALRAALAGQDADGPGLRLLAEEYVRRFGGLEPGTPVAGVFAMLAAERAAGLDDLRAQLAAAAGPDGGAAPGEAAGAGGGEGGGGGGAGGGAAPAAAGTGDSALRQRLRQGEAERAVDRFRSELQQAIRRELVADRGAAAVSRTLRVRLAEDVEIATASAAELDAVVAAIGPLASRLSKILAAREFRRRRLSVRRTLHLAMGTGGVPFRIGTEQSPPPKPEIVVLADVSGSVATFSRFTLNLLIALDSRLTRLKAFSFVDGLADITELVGEARSAGRQLTQAEAAAEAVRWTGSSDYGRVLREFAATHARQFSKRTVLLVVGDARTNYGDPAASALAEVAGRVGRLYWLNPEPQRYWNTGDSVMARYAPLCDAVRECGTMRQIADFVQSLAVR